MQNVLTTQSVAAADRYPWPQKRLPTPHCFEHGNPDLWHPVSVHDDFSEAVEICEGCPLAALCREVAETRGEWGVWGGVLYEQGRRVAR